MWGKIAGGLIILLVVTAGSWYGGWRWRDYDAVKEVVAAQTKAASDTKKLQGEIDDEKTKRSARETDLQSRLDSALAGLRKRPSYTSNGSGNNCTGADGLSLSREHGEFLERFAALCESKQDALRECYNDYNHVREVVNAGN